MISIYLGPHYFFQAPEELRWPATTITGPNNARCVVWALVCVFFPHVFSLLTNDFYFDLGPHYVLKAPKELRWAATTITGPNDASGVIWALEVRYVFFCFSSCFLLLANDFYLFRSSLFFSGTRRAMVAGDDHNGPKRRQMHHLKLGLRYVFFFSSCFFFTN